MSTSTPSTTDDMPVPSQRPREVSVDLDAELQLASLRRQFAGEDGQTVPFREWEVECRLGSGGMGAVYLARHRELGRRVALKIVKPGAPGAPGTRAARLIREAQALARVNHDNVLRIHQVDTTGGERTVIEMEYIEGPTLRKWQSQEGRTWRSIVTAYADAGEGIAAIHRAGILHRDIKPENLLVDANDRVKVADLGLAVAIGQAKGEAEVSTELEDGSILGVRLTADGAWIGTHGYMAPEVIGGLEASMASDQFSLAVSLYEAVYGTRPFVGETPQELAAAIEHGILARPRDGRRRPWWLARVLRRALRFEPDRRYPSVALFVAALRRRLGLRKWLGLGLGGAALLAGSSTLAWYGKPLPVDPCADVGAEMTAIWNEDIRAELERKTDSQAASALRLLVDTLDARAGGWVETRTLLCVAQRKRDPDLQVAEAELDARQRACLNYTKVNLEALAAQLRASERGLAWHFAESVDAIEALPTCQERRQLMHWPLETLDEGASAELAEALALETAGRFSEAEVIARKVAEQSEDGAPLHRAEALYRLGHVLGLERRDRQAFEVLDEARNVAFMIGHDELFCRATAFQAKLNARFERNAAAASRELALAQACVDRLGARSPILGADLLEARGLLAQAAGDPAEAVFWHEQALRLRREHLGAEHPRTSKSLHNLANALSLGELSEAQAKAVLRMYSECLEQRSQSTMPVDSGIAEVLFDLGEFLLRRGELGQARVHLEQAERLFSIAPGDHRAARAKLHLALAQINVEESNFDAAEVHLELALALQDDDGAQSFAEASPARWLHLDGALALRRQDFTRAANSCRRATQLHRCGDPNNQEALDSLLDEIAADYGLEDFTRIATIVGEEGERLPQYLRSLPAPERGPIAWQIAEALRRRTLWAEAAIYFEIALVSYQTAGDAESVAELRAQLERVESKLDPTQGRRTRQ